jgi:hypothetical protein
MALASGLIGKHAIFDKKKKNKKNKVGNGKKKRLKPHK